MNPDNPEASQQVSPGQSVNTAADAPRGYMSFGEHLEELRSCSILALIGIFITTTFSLVYAKSILSFVLRPLLVILHARGQDAQAQAINPPDTFLLYLKMAFLAGILLSMPWTLMQIWRFVALGLFPRERKFLKLLAPASIGLFATGALFMFYIVLPIVINFFIEFGEKITINDLEPSWIDRLLVGDEGEENVEPAPYMQFTRIVMVAQDPVDPPVGSEWYNTTRNQRCVMTDKGVFSIPMHPNENLSAVKSQFGLSQYVGFVMMLTLAFGLAFELPLVVLFITSMGLVSVSDLKKSRRYIAFGIVIAAAILTPPDVISQLLLAIPMMVLFEGALIVSRIINRPKRVGD